MKILCAPHSSRDHICRLWNQNGSRLSQLQSDWEAVSLELEQWVVCVRQLEDVLVLQTLLLVPPPKGPAGGSSTQCSIKSLLEGGRGE